MAHSSASLLSERQREGVNTIIPNRLYQRGQIMTWSLDKKRAMFDTLDIGMVVNFWSKLDSDMSSMEDITYVYMPTPHSIDMVSPEKIDLARYVCSYIWESNKGVLVLCEAGKTRSVFFCVMVVELYATIPRHEAWERVQKNVRSHSLKDFMIDYIYQPQNAARTKRSK